MAVFYHASKVLFIAVPKTGSSSFQKSLRNKNSTYCRRQNHHSTALQTRNGKHEEWETYETVAFIRNPFKWAPSSYYSDAYKTIERHQKLLCSSFEDYLERLNKTPIQWVVDNDGEVIVDKLYRTEDMADVCEGYGFPLYHDNQTLKLQEKEIEYTPYQKSLIEKKFARELEYY